MRIRDLMKRVAIDLGIVLAVVLLVGGSIVGYVWVKEGPQRAEARRQAEAFLAEEVAQRNSMENLGDLDVEPSDLNLEKLEQNLHQPTLRQPEARQKATKLGWACGKERCAIWVSFLVPFGQEIPATEPPAALMVSAPLFKYPRHLAIGGVYLGETGEEMKESCRKRGFGLETGYHRISWNKDWKLVWGESNGKVSLLMFINERMIKDAEARGDLNPSAPVGATKRDAK